MKSSRLESTTASPTREVRGRAPEKGNLALRPVDGLEGVAPDRQRSLQQEVAEIQAKAIGEFEGAERVLQDARQLAAHLVVLGTNVQGLVSLKALSQHLRRIDEAV